MPLKSDTGEVEARLFFMAYTLERSGGPETRPLMFSFNGGPGSSSVWLHLGALGPKRVKMRADGQMPSPPYRLVDNEQTLARRHRPRLHRSRRHRLQPAREARARPEVLGRPGRHRVGRGVHPALPHALRALGVAALPGRRELRHHARRGPLGLSGREGHRLQRHPAGLLDPQLPDRALHDRQRPAVPAVPADLRGDRVVPQEAAGRPAGRSRSPSSCARWRRSPRPTIRTRCRRATA